MNDLIRRSEVFDALNIVAAMSTKEQRKALSLVHGKLYGMEEVDAVPVVRCKDCKNRGTPYNCPMRKLVMPFQGAGSYEDCTEDGGYCHMGERKDGGAE